jgi:hypothetical protein
MANPLTQNAVAESCREAAVNFPAKDRFEPGQLRRLSRHDAGSVGSSSTRSGALLEIAALREITIEPDATHVVAIDDRGRYAARAEKERGGTPWHAASREIDLLRAMLADHAKRIAARDIVIGELQRRLAAADDERQRILRQLSVTPAERRSSGRLQRTIRAIGGLMDTFAEMTQALPPKVQGPIRERDAEAQPAARALAEKVLLDLIAEQHRRWVRRDGDAA